MNNRDYKKFAAGCYYHIYNRGNRKDEIFLDNNDYDFFLLRLRQNLYPNESENNIFRSSPLPSNSFSLINYCLMPNHFHFLIKQNGEIPLSKLVSRVCTSYSKYFNKKYEKVGHVFQDQFKQVLIDDNEYLKWISAYIHQNPKVAGLVSNPINYKWSSYSGMKENNPLIKDKEIIIAQFRNFDDYKKFVDSSYQIIKAREDFKNLLIDSNM